MWSSANAPSLCLICPHTIPFLTLLKGLGFSRQGAKTPRRIQVGLNDSHPVRLLMPLSLVRFVNSRCLASLREIRRFFRRLSIAHVHSQRNTSRVVANRSQKSSVLLPSFTSGRLAWANRPNRTACYHCNRKTPKSGSNPGQAAEVELSIMLVSVIEWYFPRNIHTTYCLKNPHKSWVYHKHHTARRYSLVAVLG